MKFNDLKYSEKHGTFRTLINVYNYLREDLDVYIRPDYKIVVTDYKIQDLIHIPEKITIDKIKCQFVDNNETILMIEIVPKKINIDIEWN